jgi:transcriptional regulator of arginine metabolism
LIMASETNGGGRRQAIVRILREHAVGRQAELVRLLRREGHDATQSSVSRDLRELGVGKMGDRYILPPAEHAPSHDEFAALSGFVREVRPAGSTITVVRTTTGGAQSVALAVDRAEWPEVVGTISGDDTIFVATSGARAQARLIERLRSIFHV